MDYEKDYGKMVDRLYMSLPKEALQKERFELMPAESIIEGNKTIVRNFSQIAKQVRREEQHIAKFLTKELGAQINVEEGRLIINTRFSNHQVNRAFLAYTKQYVLCSVCGKPDTHFEERQGVKVLICSACGAQNAIKKL